MTVSVKVLVEDTESEHLALGTEHGLSLYVETPQSTFLFDCGATGLAFSNAQKLHADLSAVSFVVCSHSHYDHAGGFPALLPIMRPGLLYTGAGFWEEKFAASQKGGKYTYLGAGFGKKEVDAWGIRQRVVEDVVALDDSAWLMGNFPRRFPFETIPSRFVRGEGKQPDDFLDEICLVLREDDGVAVVTGCAHPGILNMVVAVHERLGLPVRSVVGGTHLKDADDGRVDETLKRLAEMGMKRIAFCHCSGTRVRERLTDELKGCPVSTGDMLFF